MAERSEDSATQLVYRGILHALETGAVSPGQRLIESELAAHFGVGRNAIREAMQKLAARGVIDLQRNRSASIRQMVAWSNHATRIRCRSQRARSIWFIPSMHPPSAASSTRRS